MAGGAVFYFLRKVDLSVTSCSERKYYEGLYCKKYNI